MKKIALSFIILLLSFPVYAAAPYSQSAWTITWDQGSIVEDADGSDIFAATVHSDGKVYLGWGDGWGFEDTCAHTDANKVSMGVSTATGTPGSLTFAEVCGKAACGADNDHCYVNYPLHGNGKIRTLLSVGSYIYVIVNEQDGANWYSNTMVLYYSSDDGETWTRADNTAFSGGTGEPQLIAFLNFGANYANARDGYIYIYFMDDETYTNVNLARVEAVHASIIDEANWEYWDSTTGTPSWSADVADRESIFYSADTIGSFTSVVYNPTIQRYMIFGNHGAAGLERLGVFEGVEPWGPWATIEYNTAWLSIDTDESYFSAPTAWISGNDFWLIYSGENGPDDKDLYSMIKGTLATETYTTHYGDSTNVTVSGSTSNYLVNLTGNTFADDTEYLVTVYMEDTEGNSDTYSWSFTTEDTVPSPDYEIISHSNGDLSGTQAATITGTFATGTVDTLTWACPECATTTGSATLGSGTWSATVTLPSAGYGLEGLSNTSFDTDTDWTYDGGWSIAGGEAISTGGGGGGGSTEWDYNNTDVESTSYAVATDNAMGQRFGVSSGFVFDKIVFQVASADSGLTWTCRMGKAQDLTTFDEEWTGVVPAAGDNTLQSVEFTSYSIDDDRIWFGCIETGGSGTARLSYSGDAVGGSSNKRVASTLGTAWDLNYAYETHDLRAVVYKTSGTPSGSIWQQPSGLELYSIRHSCVTVDTGATGELQITPISYLGPAVTQDVSIASGEHCYDLPVLSPTSPLRYNADFTGSLLSASDKQKGDLAKITFTGTGGAGVLTRELSINYFDVSGDEDAPYAYEIYPADEDTHIPLTIDVYFVVTDVANNLSMSNAALFNFTLDSITYDCGSVGVTCTEVIADGEYTVLLDDVTLPGSETLTLSIYMEDTIGNSNTHAITFSTAFLPAAASNVTVQNATLEN